MRPQVIHDPGDPFTRAPHLSKDGAGDLQQKVADKENPAAKAKYGSAQAQFTPHLQSGKTYVHPIQIGNDVQDENERHQPPRHSPPGFFAEVHRNRRTLHYDGSILPSAEREAKLSDRKSVV